MFSQTRKEMVVELLFFLIWISKTPKIFIRSDSGNYYRCLKYFGKNPFCSIISFSEDFKVFSISNPLSVKKKKDGDLPYPVSNLKMPCGLSVGMNES
jgi:hypothetical protein